MLRTVPDTRLDASRNWKTKILTCVVALSTQLPVWPTYIQMLAFIHVTKPCSDRLPGAPEVTVGEGPASSGGMVVGPFALAKALAERSCQLEVLALSNFIEAQLFLHCFLPRQSYLPSMRMPSKLSHLALTTSNFDPTKPVSEIDSLLRAAAKAALKMESLKVMELFRIGPTSAALFQYNRHWGPNCARILWMGTWRYNIEEFVRINWKEYTLGRHMMIDNRLVEDRFSICREMKVIKSNCPHYQELLVDHSSGG